MVSTFKTPMFKFYQSRRTPELEDRILNFLNKSKQLKHSKLSDQPNTNFPGKCKNSITNLGK